jgi:hypothetical protein
MWPNSSAKKSLNPAASAVEKPLPLNSKPVSQSGGG